MFYYTFTTFDCNFIPRNAEICKVSSETKNVGKAHKYRLNRHLPTYEKIIKNLYSFLKQKGWEYEREWRIVEESTSNYFDYNPGELVGIILGTNLDSHIGDAIKHCVPSSVRILKAWPGQRTFEILITDGEYQKLGDGSPIPKITDIDSFLSSNV